MPQERGERQTPGVWPSTRHGKKMIYPTTEKEELGNRVRKKNRGGRGLLGVARIRHRQVAREAQSGSELLTECNLKGREIREGENWANPLDKGKRLLTPKSKMEELGVTGDTRD